MPQLHAAVQRQLPFVMWVNTSLSCTAMNFLTRASEGTVSVHFYIAVLSLSYMMGEKEAAAKLCAGLAVTTYLTGALKDLFCSPRPMHLCNRCVTLLQIGGSNRGHAQPASQALAQSGSFHALPLPLSPPLPFFPSIPHPPPPSRLGWVVLVAPVTA